MCAFILDFSVGSHLVTWRWTVCGLILDMSVCIGDLEMGSIWTDSRH